MSLTLLRQIQILDPDGVPGLEGEVGELALVGAVGVHDPELASPRHPVGVEDDLRTVRREAGMMVPLPVVVGQLCRLPVAAAHGPDFVVAGHAGNQRYRLAHRRPGRRPRHAFSKIGDLMAGALIERIIIKDLRYATVTRGPFLA